MGKELLKLFDTQHPAGTEIVRRINPEDLLSIIRCHPELWRNRESLIRFYLGIVNPKASVAFDLPAHLSQIVCKRIDRDQMDAQQIEQLDMMLLMAIEYGRIDIVKMLVKVFHLTSADLGRAEGWSAHTSTVASLPMIKHLTKPPAEGGFGYDGLYPERALEGAIDAGDRDKVQYIFELMRSDDTGPYDVSEYLPSIGATGDIDLMRLVLKDHAKGGLGTPLADVQEHADALIGSAVTNGHVAFLKYLLQPVHAGGLGLTIADVRKEIQVVSGKGHLPGVAKHPFMVKYIVDDTSQGGLGLTDWAPKLADAAVATGQLASLKVAAAAVSNDKELIGPLRYARKRRWDAGVEYLTTSKERGGRGLPRMR